MDSPSEMRLEKCPAAGCSRTHVIIRLRKILKKSCPDTRLVRRSVGSTEYKEKISVKRRLHPFKYMSLLALFGFPEVLNKRIMVNPPKQQGEDLTDLQKEFIELLIELLKRIGLALAIAPHVIRKYGPITITEEDLSFMRKSLLEIMHSITNDRWDRSLIEWIPILNTAKEKSPGSASRKYSAFTTDGERVRISTDHIRDVKNDPKLGDFAANFWKVSGSRLTTASMSILSYVYNDPELLLDYYELERYFDRKMKTTLSKDYIMLIL